MDGLMDKKLMPLKILIIGNFAGSSIESVQHLKISKENFQSVMSEINPRLLMRVANKLSTAQKELNIDIPFTNINDFRPESLAKQIAPINEVIEIRNSIVKLPEKKISLTEIKEHLEKSADNSLAKEIITLLDNIKEEADQKTIDNIISKIDAKLNEQFDEILHNPKFQQLESAWRGLKLLIDSSDFPDAVQFELLNVEREDMLNQFEKHIFQQEYDDSCDVPLSVILADFDFSARPNDFNTLQKMADKCSTLQVAFIASMLPEFFGLKNIVHLVSLPNLYGQLVGPIQSSWKNFMQSELARWVSLTMNRFLLRDVYGDNHDKVETFNYTEKADAGHPENYLWGRPIWLMGYVLARSFANTGACISISGLGLGGEYEGVSTREYPKSFTEKIQIPVEVIMTDDKIWNFLNVGITPLNSTENSNIVYFPLITNSYRSGRVNLHSTLSYHLYIGNVFHNYYRLHQQIPAGSKPDEIIKYVQEKIYEIIAPYGGENPDETVKVDVISSEEEENFYMVKIHVQPKLQIESKDVEFTFQLPIQV